MSRGTLESHLGCGAILQGLKYSSLQHGFHPVNTHGVPPPQSGQLKASSGSSAGKESTYNTGVPSLNPGPGRSTGEGIDYPLQYSWVSLVAQLVNNLPAMRKTWVQSLSWEDPPGEGNGTHSSIRAWRIPWAI